MSTKCKKCSEGPIKDCDKVYCDICREPYHIVCVGLSRQEASCLRVNDRRITFFCGNCNVLDTIKQLKNDVEILKNEIVILKEEKEGHGQASTQINFNSETLVTEIEERKRRAKNLIVYNIKESNKTNSADRLEEEKNIVIKAISDICDINTTNIKLGRIGKYAADKTRPLKVTLTTEDDVIKVLKNKNKTDSNIKFASDKTKMQQKFLHEVITKLNDLKSNGILNKTIKYIRGIPTIVDNTKN